MAAMVLLFRTGRETMADEVFDRRIKKYEKAGRERLALAMKKLFVGYAFLCENLPKARAAAADVLEANPDDPWALVVRMEQLGESGNKDEARKLARRILKLDPKEGSPPHLYAKRALEILSTQPAGTK